MFNNNDDIQFFGPEQPPQPRNSNSCPVLCFKRNRLCFPLFLSVQVLLSLSLSSVRDPPPYGQWTVGMLRPALCSAQTDLSSFGLKVNAAGIKLGLAHQMIFTSFYYFIQKCFHTQCSDILPLIRRHSYMRIAWGQRRYECFRGLTMLKHHNHGWRE